MPMSGPDLWWRRRHPRILTGGLGRSLSSVGAPAPTLSSMPSASRRGGHPTAGLLHVVNHRGAPAQADLPRQLRRPPRPLVPLPPRSCRTP
ncbi:hypothetical protein CP973_21365 [Streptomyces albofaciens JCM 4342]|nr:hypothetical protein CP973_21365 [Streptomyces albofaciens JCM 4342]